MSVINKVTSFRKDGMIDADIQAHLDEQNTDGWKLIAVDNLVNWYRFFWSKEVSGE